MPKSYISLEVFVATEINEVFSDRQPRQDMKVSDVLWTDPFPILRGFLVAWQNQNW